MNTFFQLISFSNGVFDTLSSNEKFSLNHLNNLSLPALDDELLKFQSLSNKTLRIYDRLDMSLTETIELADRLEESLKISPEGNLNDLEALIQMKAGLREILNELNGDKDISEHEFEILPGLGERLSMATWGSFGMRSKPTSTMHEQLKIVRKALPKLQEKLENIKDSIERIEEKNTNSGTPYLRGVMD
jgi:DNA repair exonuclease SbcCD ATPase subunit